jgi:hypothetical protein
VRRAAGVVLDLWTGTAYTAVRVEVVSDDLAARQSDHAHAMRHLRKDSGGSEGEDAKMVSSRYGRIAQQFQYHST